MQTFERIKICGTGHWSVRGELESNMWNWFLEIDGVNISEEEMWNHVPEREKGLEFIKKVRPFLSEDAEERIVPPSCVPGGWAHFEIRVSETKDPQAVERIVQEYFPRLYALALAADK